MDQIKEDEMCRIRIQDFGGNSWKKQTTPMNEG